MAMRSLVLSPEGAGGGGDGGTPKTYTQEELDAKLTGLQSNRDEVLRELKAARDALKQFEGLDPELARKTLADKKKAEEELLKAQGNWDENLRLKREEWAAEHKAKIEPLQARLDRAERLVFEKTAKAEAFAAFADPDVKAFPEITWRTIRDELAVQETEGGDAVVVVKGKDGKPRVHPTTNKLVTIKERLLELKADPMFQPLFESTTGSGSGRRGDGGSGNNADLKDLAPVNRLTEARKRGLKS